MHKIRAIGACIIIKWLENAVWGTSVVDAALTAALHALNVKDEGTARSVL